MFTKYSFVIPAFNNKRNLLNSLCCLKAVNRSAEYQFEVVVVDDGSTEDLCGALSVFRSHFNLTNIRIERDHKSCRSRARNVGWKSAKGKYIVFLDSDILVKPDYLFQLDRYFSAINNPIVIGNRVHLTTKVLSDNLEDMNAFSNEIKSSLGFSNLDYRYLVYSAKSFNGSVIPDSWLYVYSCNMAVEKSHLLSVDGFDENYIEWGLEDIDLAVRLYRQGLAICVNPYLDVFHQAHGHRDDIAIGAEKLECYKKNIKYFLEKFPGILDHYSDPAHRLIVGEDYFYEESNLHCVEYFPGIDLKKFKLEVEEYLRVSARSIVVKDYSTDSDLDVWVQNHHRFGSKILYFPMSKVVNVERMMAYVRGQRNKNALAAKEEVFQHV